MFNTVKTLFAIHLTLVYTELLTPVQLLCRQVGGIAVSQRIKGFLYRFKYILFSCAGISAPRQISPPQEMSLETKAGLNLWPCNASSFDLKVHEKMHGKELQTVPRHKISRARGRWNNILTRMKWCSLRNAAPLLALMRAVCALTGQGPQGPRGAFAMLPCCWSTDFMGKQNFLLDLNVASWIFKDSRCRVCRQKWATVLG